MSLFGGNLYGGSVVSQDVGGVMCNITQADATHSRQFKQKNHAQKHFQIIHIHVESITAHHMQTK
jgi:hypothetical protein